MLDGLQNAITPGPMQLQEQKQAGVKYDNNKPPVMRGVIRYFPRALREVAKVSQAGARKYTWEGWRTVPDGENRYADARARHELAYAQGEFLDGETETPHLAQVAWNALAELELVMVRLEQIYEQPGTK